VLFLPAAPLPTKGNSMLKQYTEEELFNKPRSAEQEERIRKLEALQAAGDEGIDFSDIPEIREIPKDAVRGRFFRGAPVYIKKDLYLQLSAIADRKGVSLSDLVSQLLRKEIGIGEVLA
jgi:hypothetical protein